jgi:hypothetical protein
VGLAHQLQRGPADILLRRPRVLPAVEHVAAHHRARSPRNATCRFSLPSTPAAVTAAAPPTRSCPRRAPCVPPANPEDSRAGRPPHAHPPRRPGSPAAPLLIGPRPRRSIRPAPSGSAGRFRRGRGSDEAARRLDWTESNRLVSLSLLLPFYLFLFARWCAVESFSTSGEGAKKSTAHALVPPEGGGLRFWKRRRKWLQPAYRPRAYRWGVLLVLVGRWVAVPIRELERAVY